MKFSLALIVVLTSFASMASDSTADCLVTSRENHPLKGQVEAYPTLDGK